MTLFEHNRRPIGAALCVMALALAACNSNHEVPHVASTGSTASDRASLNPPSEGRVLMKSEGFDAALQQVPEDEKPTAPKIDTAVMNWTRNHMHELSDTRSRTLFMHGQMLAMHQVRPTVDFETTKGTFSIQVNPYHVPMTAGNFIDLVVQGTYDGTKFTKYEKGFLIQGGDPSGTGSGGPGYTILDELGPMKHDAGVVGMAKAGPNSAGSQFYITLAPAPKLDGSYTVFGKVVSGMDVVRSLRVGDRILKATAKGLPPTFSREFVIRALQPGQKPIPPEELERMMTGMLAGHP